MDLEMVMLLCVTNALLHVSLVHREINVLVVHLLKIEIKLLASVIQDFIIMMMENALLVTPNVLSAHLLMFVQIVLK